MSRKKRAENEISENATDSLEFPSDDCAGETGNSVKVMKNFDLSSASSMLDNSLSSPISESDSESSNFDINDDELKDFGYSDACDEDSIDSEIKTILHTNNNDSKDDCGISDDDEKSDIQRKLEAIASEIKEDTVLKIDNLKNKALLEAQLKAKWASKLMFAKAETKELKKKHDLLVASLTDMCQKDSTIGGSYLALKQKTDSFINNSTEVKSIRQAMSDNKQVIEFLEYCYDIMKGFGFTIKNSLDATKIEMGI